MAVDINGNPITPQTPGADVVFDKPNIPDCWGVQPVDQIPTEETPEVVEDNNDNDNDNNAEE